MAYRRRLIILLLLAGASSLACAQTAWPGFDVAFEKPNFTDPEDPLFQDRITDEVWITRDIEQGIYNIQQEDRYTDISPAGTEWAFAGINFNPAKISAEQFELLNFSDWATALGGQGGLAENILVRAGVVHLIAEDIYIDVMFTGWTTRGDGGGFAYLRGGPPAPPTPIRGTLTEALTDTLVCRNLATGERVVAPGLGGASEWDCSAAGLNAESGEPVLAILRGRAACAGACAPAGSVEGLDLRVTRCTNLVSGQVVAPIPDGVAFDCASADLLVSDGEALQLILFGNAGP